MPNEYQDLSRFVVPPDFRGGSKLRVQLWWMVKSSLFHWSPRSCTDFGDFCCDVSAQPLAKRCYGKVEKNDWEAANLATLLCNLSQRYPEASLLIIGSTVDFDRAQYASASWRGDVVNVCGKLSPRASAGAMHQATAFIGHDSGPLHLAAASGVACVGLFGDNNPRGVGILGGPSIQAKNEPNHLHFGINSIMSIKVRICAIGGKPNSTEVTSFPVRAHDLTGENMNCGRFEYR